MFTGTIVSSGSGRHSKYIKDTEDMTVSGNFKMQKVYSTVVELIEQEAKNGMIVFCSYCPFMY